MPPVNSSSSDQSTSGVESAAVSATEQAAQSASEQTTQNSDVAAESSTAKEGVKGPASPLEAVKAALEATRSSEQPKDKGAESPPRVADGKVTGEANPDGEKKEESLEDKSFSPDANKRIRTLVAERNSFREELETLKAESSVYREQAEAYTTIVSRVRETGASAEQVDQAVELLGMLNHNPARAYEMLTPIYQQLEQFVGGRLPADLQEKVDGGYIDEASAQELARLRNTSRFSEQRTHQLTQEQQAAENERNLNGLRTAVARATDDWDAAWKSRDPDYQRKHPFVMREIRASLAELGGVASPEQAVKIADAALKAVNEQLSSLLPPKQEVRTVTGGNPSLNAAPRPGSPLEAARLALRQPA